MRLGYRRLLLQRDRPAVGVELDHPVGGRIGHPVRENGSAGDFLEALQAGAEAGAVEDVVPQDQCHRLGPDM